MLNIVIEKWAFSGGCGLEVECGWFFCCFGKFWKLLVCRVLVKGCKIFCKKVGKKFGMRGKTAVPLQPQTGNGGSRPRKESLRGLRGREKVVTFAVPPFGCGERTLK